MRARHRMSKLLLRHDVRYEGTAAAWTTHHRRWLGAVDLGDRGAQVTLLDYLGAIDALLLRRDTLEATIDELILASPWAETIGRLRCLDESLTLPIAVGAIIVLGAVAMTSSDRAPPAKCCPP
jgi:transposase